MLEEASRSLPPFALYPATVLLFLLLVRACRKTPYVSGKLVLIAVWLRYVMQAYHEVTYTSFGGISINAMGTFAVVCAGILVLRGHLREALRFPVILTLLGVVVASGLLNGALVPTIETLLKWGYFFVVLLSVQDCIRRDGDARILGLLLWSVAPPLVYQLLSVVLGVAKATESDGSISYIGGYYHEAAFSVVLVTAFAVASLAPRLNITARLFLLTVSLAGIFAANYRTSLIAVAPIAFGYFVFGIARGASRAARVFVSMTGLVVTICGLLVANIALSERLQDLSKVATDSPVLVQSPEEFTVAEQKLLSGRIYIWNRYLDSYSTGSDAQLLLGFGPDSWVETFGVYAHNTIISYLYEFGLVGAVLIVMVWIGMLSRTMRVRDWTLRGQLVCSHIGFILLNMATMPFWQIEGLILYGVLCGYTICVGDAPARPLGRSPQKPLWRPHMAQPSRIPDGRFTSSGRGQG